MMVDPGFVSGLVGYGITKSLDEVLKWLKQSLSFPKEYLALESRLVRIRPMVEAIEDDASPGSASHQPEVGKWVDDLKTLLDDLKKLLDEGSDFKKGRLNEPLKKRKFVADLAKLTERFDALLRDGVLVTLVKLDSVLAKKESADETADYLEKLSQLLQTTADKQASVTQRNHDSIMEVLLMLAKKVDDIGYMQHLVQGLGIQDRQWISSSAPVDHPLASTLKELSERTGRDKRCKVKLEIAEPTDNPPNRFRPPREIVPDKPAQASPSDHRGRAVEGGFEVHNDTKVQLTFEVTFSDAWFFYILQVDHAAEGTTPEIFFPKSVGEEEDYNQLLSQRNKEKRVFPRQAFYEDDPLSLKLVRSNIAATDSYDRVSLYVLVVNTCLTPDRKSSDAITIEDVENALNRMLPQELDSKNIIVKHFQFDLKPSQSQLQ